jgi:polyhydroxybutyrate depolymerase
MTRTPVLSLILLGGLAGCGTSGASPSHGGGDSGSPAPPSIPADAGADADAAAGILAARPYTLFVPDAYDAAKPTPVLFMLHGYSANGAAEEALMQLSATAQAHVFLYAYADGTRDSQGKRFWNATDACCNFDHIPVDDVAYIDAILADIAGKYTVDAKRVFLVGHSNGAFMAHRYACDRAGNVAGIVSLAGATWEDPSLCKPTVPVAVVQVHGDADMEIGYDGGATTDFDGATHPYPSAHETVARWAALDTCPQPLSDGGSLSLDTSVAPGATQVERYGGCVQTAGVELWTMHGSGHIPSLDASWGESIWAFLSAHPKP